RCIPPVKRFFPALILGPIEAFETTSKTWCQNLPSNPTSPADLGRGILGPMEASETTSNGKIRQRVPAFVILSDFSNPPT
ncbi:MAG: hypothetical protein PVG41_18705, partial [Desulfobacteraceae bacterium]